MEVKGTITQLLPIQKGQGKNGEWKKQDFILETTSSQYPKKVCMSAWGDKIDQFNLKEGELVNASIELESREYNGRWYTDVRVWKLQKEGSASESTPGPSSETDLTSFSGEEPDDLPF